MYEKNKVNNFFSAHFLDFKEDSLIVRKNKNRAEYLSFYKDALYLKNKLIILNTHPRTLGKNLKSTDILTKYDKDLNIILKKDMDISKYPSGNCLIIGDDDKLFYITDGYGFKDRTKFVISEIDDSFNVLNQKIIERKTKEAFRCDPMQFVFIKGFGLVVVSELKYQDGNIPSTFKIEMFDLDLNKKWSEDLKVNATEYLGNSKSKIFLVSEKEGRNTISSFYYSNFNEEMV